MEQIKADLDISIDPKDFAEEFSYHLMFMINRLRFKIHQPNAILEELKTKFPLAYEMSGIAAKVIEQEEGLKVNQDERGHLASYFGVFLEENHIGQRRRDLRDRAGHSAADQRSGQEDRGQPGADQDYVGLCGNA